MSAALTDSAPSKPQESVKDVCIPEHCFHAFDALYCALTNATPIQPTFPDDEYPLFVTWNTRSSRPGRSPRLRGCIGNFHAMPLRDGLAEYALISAFQDTRFRKIDYSELESLECKISLLAEFEDAKGYLDWEIGTHGISITFPHPSLISSTSSSSEAPSPLSSTSWLSLPRSTSKQTFSACYLPDVMPEQGWTKVEAVDSAINKAGWNGRITEDLRRAVKLRRYQSKVCCVGWNEYIQWRNTHE